MKITTERHLTQTQRKYIRLAYNEYKDHLSTTQKRKVTTMTTTILCSELNISERIVYLANLLKNHFGFIEQDSIFHRNTSSRVFEIPTKNKLNNKAICLVADHGLVEFDFYSEGHNQLSNYGFYVTDADTYILKLLGGIKDKLANTFCERFC